MKIKLFLCVVIGLCFSMNSFSQDEYGGLDKLSCKELKMIKADQVQDYLILEQRSDQLKTKISHLNRTIYNLKKKIKRIQFDLQSGLVHGDQNIAAKLKELSAAKRALSNAQNDLEDSQKQLASALSGQKEALDLIDLINQLLRKKKCSAESDEGEFIEADFNY